MKKKNILKSLIAMVVSAFLVLTAVGCQAEPAPKPEIAPDPFTSVWGPGGEHIVTFSGDSAGHFAGEESEFILKLNNNSSEPWKVEYYLHLLDTDTILTEIAHDTVNVPAGLEPQIDIAVVFDEGLDGPYGLSLYTPTLEAQSVNTIWIGEKSAVSIGGWPSIASHPWLWPGSEDDKPDSVIDETVIQSAESFIKNSPTFVFDGIEGSLELINTGAYSERTISEGGPVGDITRGWELTYRFESRHAGYGDRTGEMLAQVVTPHEVNITIENGEVVSAMMDAQWDMINQEMVGSKYTEEAAGKTAEEFIKNSPTFTFDGIQESLEIVETLYPDIENAWQFVFHFESAHASYGDRTGQMLAEVITPHEAIITVEQGEIKNAVMDGKWDMVNQRMIDEIEISLAPIHEVEELFMKSFPVQIGVHTKGGLRNGCTTFRDAVVTREGDTINIGVTAQKPKDAICPAVYNFFEDNLNLGCDFTAGATYTLKVNDYITTFVAP